MATNSGKNCSKTPTVQFNEFWLTQQNLDLEWTLNEMKKKRLEKISIKKRK